MHGARQHGVAQLARATGGGGVGERGGVEQLFVHQFCDVEQCDGGDGDGGGQRGLGDGGRRSGGVFAAELFHAGGVEPAGEFHAGVPFAVAGVWGLPYAEQVVGTIMAIDAFLGIVLGLSSARYNQNFPDGIVNSTPAQQDDALKLQSKMDYEATIQKMKERD